MALQSLTTREPDDQQIEIAITALGTAVKADGLEEEQLAGSPESPA